MSTDVILHAEGVSKRFQNFVALDNVSVSFPRSRLTAVIGPNGAGKSTFFNVISGAFLLPAGASSMTALTSRVSHSTVSHTSE